MKVLAENKGYKLSYSPDLVNRWQVWREVPIGISGMFKFDQMVAQSSVFSKKLKAFFTKKQIQTALAKFHAMKHASRKTAK